MVCVYASGDGMQFGGMGWWCGIRHSAFGLPSNRPISSTWPNKAAHLLDSLPIPFSFLCWCRIWNPQLSSVRLGSLLFSLLFFSPANCGRSPLLEPIQFGQRKAKRRRERREGERERKKKEKRTAKINIKDDHKHRESSHTRAKLRFIEWWLW